MKGPRLVSSKDERLQENIKFRIFDYIQRVGKFVGIMFGLVKEVVGC